MRHSRTLAIILACSAVACGSGAVDKAPPLNKGVAADDTSSAADSGRPTGLDTIAATDPPDAAEADAGQATQQAVKPTFEAGVPDADAGVAPADPPADSGSADVVAMADAMDPPEATVPDADGGPKTFDYTFEMPGYDVAVGDAVPAKFTYVGACGGEVTVNFFRSFAQAASSAEGIAGQTTGFVDVCLGPGTDCNSWYKVSCTNGVLVVSGTAVVTSNGFTPTPDGGALDCTCP